jgi:uncharacterized protein
MVTSVYAAALGLLFVALSLAVIRQRRAAQVALGDAGNVGLQRAIRVHGNFAEYVPLGLLLVLLVELQTGWLWAVHLLGVALLAGRLLHAYGVSQRREDFRFRVAGMMLTFGVLALASALLLVTAILPL